MPAPHERRTRPYDPKDRDRLDRRTQPIPIARPGLFAQRYFFAMPGDFSRIVKVIGILAFGLFTYIRFSSSTPLLTFIVATFALAAVAVMWSSAIGTLNRLDFVRANEFANPDAFVRRAKFLHITELAAAVVWVIWLGFPFGRFDWIPIALVVTAAVFALIQRWRLTKISQPRNVWEK